MNQQALRVSDGLRPVAARAERVGRVVTIGGLAHPLVYLIPLVLLYAFSFGHTSIMGWGSFTDVDARYLNVYVGYVACFVIGVLVATAFSARSRPSQPITYADRGIDTRIWAVFAVSMVCVVAVTFRAGGFAAFADDAMIFRRDSIAALGGYVDYPATLITPLTAVFAWRFVNTRRPIWAAVAVCCIALQVLQLNRQEMSVAITVALLVIFFTKRVSLTFVLSSLAGLIAAVYILGLIAIFRRGGAEYFSSGIDTAILPFYVVLEDFVLGVKLAHYTTDLVGNGGFHGTYVLGYFIAVAVPGYGRRIGGTIVSQMLNADTSQSLGSPLSFFADGGMTEVVIAGLAQGWLAAYLYKKARGGSVYAQFGYALNLLSLLFHLRGGLVSFDPVWIYEIAALSFVFGLKGVSGNGRFLLAAMRLAFVLTIPISLIALVARL